MLCSLSTFRYSLIFSSLWRCEWHSWFSSLSNTHWYLTYTAPCRDEAGDRESPYQMGNCFGMVYNHHLQINKIFFFWPLTQHTFQPLLHSFCFPLQFATYSPLLGPISDTVLYLVSLVQRRTEQLLFMSQRHLSLTHLRIEFRRIKEQYYRAGCRTKLLLFLFFTLHECMQTKTEKELEDPHQLSYEKQYTLISF